MSLDAAATLSEERAADVIALCLRSDPNNRIDPIANPDQRCRSARASTTRPDEEQDALSVCGVYPIYHPLSAQDRANAFVVSRSIHFGFRICRVLLFDCRLEERQIQI